MAYLLYLPFAGGYSNRAARLWIAGTYCPLWDSLVLWNSETIKAWERDTRSQVTAEHYRRDAVGFTGNIIFIIIPWVM